MIPEPFASIDCVIFVFQVWKLVLPKAFLYGDRLNVLNV